MRAETVGLTAAPTGSYPEADYTRGTTVQWSRAGMPRSMRCVSQATASSTVAKISFWST
jgi:hypothetical protein